MVGAIQETLSQNLDRVENLITVYESHPDAKKQGRKSAETLDILRAAVVLLHASLEDVLRRLAYWKWPTGNSATLDKIPLVGLGSGSLKHSLGDLTKHRGKAIDDVLRESVDAYLERSNYNNTSEVSSLLSSVGVRVSAVSQHFDVLQNLMERRHQIVHRADRKSEVKGSGDHEIQSIHKDTVREWANAVKQFSEAVLKLV